MPSSDCGPAHTGTTPHKPDPTPMAIAKGIQESDLQNALSFLTPTHADIRNALIDLLTNDVEVAQLICVRVVDALDAKAMQRPLAPHERKVFHE